MICEPLSRWRRLTLVAGAVIAPLTQVFLSTKTIKVPTHPGQVDNVMDMMDYFDDVNTYSYIQGWEHKDNNRVSLQTRSLLTSASNSDLQPRIWQESYNCSWYMQSQRHKQLPDACETGGATFGVLSLLKAPYLAQLPKDYSKFLIVVQPDRRLTKAVMSRYRGCQAIHPSLQRFNLQGKHHRTGHAQRM